MSTKTAGTITRDPELSLLALLDRKLAAMTPDARGRCLAWLVTKYSTQDGFSLSSETKFRPDPSSKEK